MADDRRTSDSDDSRATFVLNPSSRLGLVFAERFRIERFLGAGAYGEVYEAYDLNLDQRVAVKLLRADLDRDAALLERFRREVRTARQVSHPNVCRVHDLFEHREIAPDGAVRAVQLLSMELLAGETLADRIGRFGAIGREEASTIAQQLAAGLDAAHRAGVLHRDFKSGNVLLTEDSRGPRAVITDFGLARAAFRGTDRGTLTAVGTVLGSPAYMAPEQVRGEATTAASDIYSFGVVLYEMVSGQLPFQGDSALQTALMRLRQPPKPPRELVPGLDSAWESAILRCLELEADDRPAKAADAVAELVGEASPPRRLKLGGWRRRRWIRVAPWFGVAGLAAAVALLGALWSVRRGQVPGAADSRRVSVAVVGLENLSHQEDLAYIDHAFSEMLPMEIAGAGGVRVVPSEQVRRARADLGLALSGTLSPESLSRLRRLTGADRVVVGSYLANPGPVGERRLRFDLAVQDADRGTVIQTLKQEGDEASLLATVESLGARLRTAFGGGEITGTEAQEVAATRPRSREGMQAYAEGLARLRIADVPGALRWLEQAVAVEPDNPLVHNALASTWLALGFERRALEEASRALNLASGLPEQQRWAIEARYRGLAGEHAAAVALHRRLTEAEPDDLDHLLDLAWAEVAAHRASEALATVARLRSLAEPARRDPRIDLVEARAANSLGDHARVLAAADRAVGQGEQLGAKLLTARGHLLRAMALRQLGRTPEAAAAAEKARALCEAAEDFATASMAQLEIASVRMLAGDLDDASVAYRRAADLAQRAQSRTAVASALNGLAVASRRAGRLVDAERAFTDLRRTYQELGERFGEAATLNGLALVHLTAGRLDLAGPLLEQARAALRTLGSKTGEAAAALNLASLRLLQGRLGEARQLADGVLAQFRELGEEGGVAEAELVVARLDAWEDRLVPARALLIAATNRAEAAGELGPVATGRMELARLDLEAGGFESAVDLARRAVAAAREEAALADEARALLVRCLQAAARSEDAAAERAALGSARPTAIVARLELARADAALAPAAPAARVILGAALDEARRAGLQAQEFEIRLEMAKREASLAGHELLELARSARAAGLLTTARRAEELRTERARAAGRSR